MNPLYLYPINPPYLSMLLSFHTYCMIILIIILMIKKIKSMGDHRTFVIWKGGTQSIKSYPIKDGELQIKPSGLFKRSEQWTPRVEPDNILPSKKSFRQWIMPFGFKQKDIVIAVEDAPTCIRLKGALLEEIPEQLKSVLLKTWTKEGIRRYLNKALALASVERKIFSDKQFYMFFAVMLAILYLSFQIAAKVGVF